MLVRADPPGIVTDRDLRNRVLGAGLGPDTPVARVVSRPLRTVAADDAASTTPGLTLLDAGVHHLPVDARRRDRGRAHLDRPPPRDRPGAGGGAAQRRAARLARQPPRLRRGGSRRWSSSLLAGGLDADGHRRPRGPAERRAAAAASCAGPRRTWGRRPRPTPGSCSGRRGAWSRPSSPTRTTRSSTPTRGPAARDWFQALRRAGQRRPGGGRASRAAPAATWRQWHGTLAEWAQRFAGLDRRADAAGAPGGLDLLRLPAGGRALDLEPLEADRRARPRSARSSSASSPRTRSSSARRRLLLRLRGESSSVDLKRTGSARSSSSPAATRLEAGHPARATLGRLEAAARAGLLARTRFHHPRGLPLPRSGCACASSSA